MTTFPGVLGLLGGDELNPPCRPFDEALLAACGEPREVRIVVAAVAKSGSVDRAMAHASGYFAGLGRTAVDVGLRRRGDAGRAAVVGALEAPGLTYVLGGDPGYLLDTVAGTAAWAAMLRSLGAGGGLAGSSAGAMVVCGSLLLRSSNPRPAARHAREALGLVPSVVLVPHLNRFAQGWLEAARRECPGQDVIGLDEATGLVYAHGWTAYGPGEVKLWRGGGEAARAWAEGDRPRIVAPRL